MARGSAASVPRPRIPDPPRFPRLCAMEDEATGAIAANLPRQVLPPTRSFVPDRRIAATANRRISADCRVARAVLLPSLTRRSTSCSLEARTCDMRPDHAMPTSALPLQTRATPTQRVAATATPISGAAVSDVRGFSALLSALLPPRSDKIPASPVEINAQTPLPTSAQQAHVSMAETAPLQTQVTEPDLPRQAEAVPTSETQLRNVRAPQTAKLPVSDGAASHAARDTHEAAENPTADPGVQIPALPMPAPVETPVSAPCVSTIPLPASPLPTGDADAAPVKADERQTIGHVAVPMSPRDPAGVAERPADPTAVVASPYVQTSPAVAAEPATVVASLAQSALAPTLTSSQPAPASPSHAAQAAIGGSNSAIVETQIAPAVVRLALGEDRSRLQLELNPQSLGHLSIAVQRGSDGTANIALTAERPETLALLQQSGAQLSHALDRAGVATEGRIVTFHLAPTPIAATNVTADHSSPSSAGANLASLSGQSGGQYGGQSGGQRAATGPINYSFGLDDEADPGTTSLSTASAYGRSAVDITA